MKAATRAEICAVACADAFRGDGEILASPIGLIPALGARLARATFEPDLLLSDGAASLASGTLPLGPDAPSPTIEGWLPYRRVFDTLWAGQRHVMMGASQLDRFGNQNISCVGDWQQPKVQLIGVRGSPGNTINHTTSYWIPRHGPRIFVERVDMVCGLGYDRAAALGTAARFHEIRRVISNLAVFDFATESRQMRLRSLHPGVSLDQVIDQTSFELELPDQIAATRLPSDEELRLIRELLDPGGVATGSLPT